VSDIAEVALAEPDEAGAPSGQRAPAAGVEDSIRDAEPGEVAAPVASDDLTVRDIMTPAVVSVTEDATVSEVASKMLDSHVHRLVVTRGGLPLGIITTSDLLGLLVDER